MSCTMLRVASGRSPRRSRARFESARETLDVVNPYVTDRGMIRRVGDAARRGVRVRLFVPANANNWACAAAQRFHHADLLDAGVRILEYPTMLHAKAFVRDGEELLVGTCNLEAWSLKRFFEIDLQLSLAGGRGPVRRAVQPAGRGGFDSRSGARGGEGARAGRVLRRDLAASLSGAGERRRDMLLRFL